LKGMGARAYLDVAPKVVLELVELPLFHGEGGTRKNVRPVPSSWPLCPAMPRRAGVGLYSRPMALAMNAPLAALRANGITLRVVHRLA
jgi:hypothetical protein